MFEIHRAQISSCVLLLRAKQAPKFLKSQRAGLESDLLRLRIPACVFSTPLKVLYRASVADHKAPKRHTSLRVANVQDRDLLVQTERHASPWRVAAVA